MSIKQEHVTEVRVVAILSKLTCDGCSAVMAEETTKVNFYVPEDKYEPVFNLAPGWVEISKGQYGNRIRAHACGKCLDNRVGALFSK